ncbi:S-adenosylmethionine decarboxylase proenzyme [Operophtera brumata]|uniref:adenosylmethionine decarboxylase n=1 Tax=Operophtera brumata TaxID=104452 RepID=A0A0L7LLK8_OPEBR|nr:S-adenosylmethionine decarboxylase proenzyme [Operophtera brumata]
MAETEILNSSENNEQFFEGVEKLIEIWFTPAKNADLRKIPRQQWENVLKIVRCEIISFTQSEQVDAYVLSESSMFVSRRRFILKTCGTTTPLRCVRAVLALARDMAGHACVHNVFYSRREFARPQAQLQPHDNFDSEVKLLDSYFGDGRAYIMGPDQDCWYLYTLLPLEGTVDALEMEQHKVDIRQVSSEPDQTIEILMSDLDPAGCYMTIHITPERSCSYVSFESNVPVSSYDEVISRVLRAFRPAKFVLTVFATPDSPAAEAPRQLKQFSSLGAYTQKESQYCRFSGYELHYALYCKFPS